jgi:hypothetical protein
MSPTANAAADRFEMMVGGAKHSSPGAWDPSSQSSDVVAEVVSPLLSLELPELLLEVSARPLELLVELSENVSPPVLELLPSEDEVPEAAGVFPSSRQPVGAAHRSASGIQRKQAIPMTLPNRGRVRNLARVWDASAMVSRP